MIPTEIMPAANKHWKIAIAVSTCILCLTVMVAFFDSGKIVIAKFSSNHDASPTRSFLPCEVALNLDDGSIMEMRILISYHDETQKKKLQGVIASIKNEIIMGVDPASINRIRQGNGDEFRENVISLIKQKTGTQVHDVFISSLMFF